MARSVRAVWHVVGRAVGGGLQRRGQRGQPLGHAGVDQLGQRVGVAVGGHEIGHGLQARLSALGVGHVAAHEVLAGRCGDPALLQPGLGTVTERTGRPVLGVVPHTEGLWADAEDSLALSGREVVAEAPLGRDGLDVAVIALPRLSNVTDADALAAEPGVSVRLAGDAPAVATADLVIVPGSKHTVGDLAWLRQRGIDAALADRAARGAPIVGVCGGAQMLGARIVDHVESHAGEVAGLGLAPLATEFADTKQLGWARGHSPALDGAATQGYRIAHGRVTRHGGQPLLVTDDGGEDGCAAGAVLATTWHGVAEADGWRRALLA
ncbi:MAG: cobyric acid synthase CobQ, partial [Actinobacteria bacterium QS_5_72_10]